MPPKVSIIILNWNGYEDTMECLESLKKIDYPDYDVTVVDNGSRDGSDNKIEKAFPEIKLIRNKGNLGFTGGNNVGIREALRRGVEFVLLLNNDTIVARSMLSELVKGMGNMPDAGIAGPKIFFKDRPKYIWFAGGKMSDLTGRPFQIDQGKRDNGMASGPTEKAFITGCAMLIRSDLLRKIGSLDDDYFNNLEDVDFCLKAKEVGYRSLYVPASRVFHKVSSAMGGSFTPFHVYYQTRNILLLNKKRHIAKTFYLPSIWFSFLRRIVYFMVTRKFACISALSAGIYDYYHGAFGEGRGREFVIE